MSKNPVLTEVLVGFTTSEQSVGFVCDNPDARSPCSVGVIRFDSHYFQFMSAFVFLNSA